MISIVLATGNRGKIKELRALLGGLPINLLTLDDVPDVGPVIEDGATFRHNALKKARHVAKATGLPALADDSGLAVAALDGAPGVRSARYAGEGATDAANRDRLKEALAGTPQRDAYFFAHVCVCAPDGRILAEASGRCDGVVTDVERGEGGFGYDPIFIPSGEHRTMAELSPEQKQAISHRGAALKALLPALKSWVQT